VKAEAIALASTIGSVRASKVLGISYRNIARWLREPASSPIIAKAEATIAERLLAAHEKALTALEADLDNPNARLSDRARALEVLGEQAALANGRATANIDLGGASQSDQTDHLPPELVDLLHRVYDQCFVLFLDQHGRGTQRVVCDGVDVWIEGRRENPWLPAHLRREPLPALPAPGSAAPPADIRAPVAEITATRLPDPLPPRRRLVNSRGEIQ
jgi:hypothetical protein